MNEHAAAIGVFAALLLSVSALGFVAARWQRGNPHSLEEWGLAGRGFGTVLSWFLIGGDLYTAYTFIAIPALVFGAGAIGFFGVPYTILIYPMAFAVLPRLWKSCQEHGYVTAADWVHGQFGNRWLALAVACTGIVATMPYIALQLIGIRVVIAGLGFPTHGFVGQIPLILAFLLLAAYTYTSGLRAPALIAIVKDVLIYITIIAAVVVIPQHLGGYKSMFAAMAPGKELLHAANAVNFGGISAYITLAFGSACALLLYPHTLTAMLSARNRQTIRRNAALLPAYSLLLGFLSLMGVMALRAGVAQMPQFASYFAEYKANFAVPALYLAMFPDWFVGVAFAAIAIGALVPAAIMSIAAGNLFTRNVFREFFSKEADDATQTLVAKQAALVIKLGSLLFIFLLPQAYAVNLQLLGGVWIIQTLPTMLSGLYSRVFSPISLLSGWAIGIIIGTASSAVQGFSPIYPLQIGTLTIPCYTAVLALAANIIVTSCVALASPPHNARAIS